MAANASFQIFKTYDKESKKRWKFFRWDGSRCRELKVPLKKLFPSDLVYLDSEQER